MRHYRKAYRKGWRRFKKGDSVILRWVVDWPQSRQVIGTVVEPPRNSSVKVNWGDRSPQDGTKIKAPSLIEDIHPDRLITIETAVTLALTS